MASRKDSLVGDRGRKPPAVEIRPDGVPESLRLERRFVAWSWEWRADRGGSGKWTKPPLRPDGTGYAKSDDPATWGTFGDALALVERGRADGVGFVLGDGWAGADFDDCRDPDTGDLDPGAERLLRLLPSYAEVSPSGTGVKVIGRGRLPGGGRKAGGVELYDRGRYFTVTGWRLRSSPPDVRDITAGLAELHAELFPPAAEPVPVQPPAPTGDTDADLLVKAAGAANGEKFRRLWSGDVSGYGSPSEADLALCSLLAFWCGPDPGRVDRLFRQSGLMRPKWDERHSTDGRSYGRLTVDKALEGRGEYYQPSQPWGVILNGTGFGSGSDPIVPTTEPNRIRPGQERALLWPIPKRASELERLPEGLKWLWHGLLNRGGVALLSALWKVGKTTMLTHLFRAFGEGGPFLGQAVTPGRVLIVSEEPEHLWAERRDELGLKDHLEFLCRPFRARPSPADWVSFVCHVAKLIKDRSYDLTVLDTVSRMWPVEKENDASQVDAALMPLHGLTESAGLLIVHHLRKGDGAEATGTRGSGALPAFVDTILEMRRFNPGDRRDRRRVLSGYGRYRETPDELVIELREEGYALTARDRASLERREAVDVLYQALPATDPGLTVNQLVEATGMRKEDLLKLLWFLVEDCKAQFIGSGRKGDPYLFRRA